MIQSIDINNFGFLNCYGARNYDPGTGRFLSEDPIGFKGGDINLFRYLQNQPVNYTDPTGNYSSSGNDCESKALMEYFVNLDTNDLRSCDVLLEKAMDRCDRKVAITSGKELTPVQIKEEKLEQTDIVKQRLEEHKLDGQRRLKEMRDKAMRGEKL